MSGPIGSAITLACAAAVACSLGVTAAAQPADLDRRVALVSRYLEALRLQAGIPGLSAAILANGRIVAEWGSGFADVQDRVAATPDTLYPIASLTKTFASTLLMQCVDAATLDLDTPIRTYTSAVPDTAATVGHVLAMVSDAPAGSRFRYDGDRFSALSAVVQGCTGLSFRSALATRVLDRLGMFDSVPGHDLATATADVSGPFAADTLERYRRVLTRLSTPYAVRNGRASTADYPPRGINAAAGLLSTVRDLARFDAALDARLLVSPAAQSLAWTPFLLSDRRTSPYAFGWFVQSTEAGRAIWHYGLWPTFSSLYLKLPDRGVTLLMLANSDGLSARFPLSEGDVSTSPFARAFIAAMR